MNSVKWKIGWGLSNRCNMACKFCYSRKVRREQSNFANILQAGVEFVQKNSSRIDSINFGTGEPTVEPAFFSFCDRLKSVAPEVMIGVTTNGNLAKAVENPYNLDIFIRCIEDVDVSLDFGNLLQQDDSRNYKGAFQSVIDTLKLCHKYKKNTTIVSVMHKYNCSIHNFESMIRIARIYGASFRINILRPTVDYDFALPYSDLKCNFIKLIDEYEVESIADPLLAALVDAECPNGDPTAKSSFRILPNGYITPSTYLLDSNWQAIRVDEIDDIDSLHDLDCFKTIKSVELPEFCKKCKLQEKCRGGVFDRRWLWYHDFKEHDPYCPFRFDDDLEWQSLSGKVIYSKERKSFVHDGYLPTLIFNPSINKRALNQWDNIYLKSGNDYAATEPDKYVVRTASYLLANEEISVLDIGSGTGRNGKYFLRKGNAVTFVESSKIANDMLLKSLFEDNRLSGYTLIETDMIDYLQIAESNTFDTVIAMHIISHGTADIINDCYLKNILRILKVKGIACITLPSTQDVRCPNHKANIVEYALESGPEEGIVHSFYSRDAIVKYLNGFEILEMEETTIKITGTSHWNVILRKQ